MLCLLESSSSSECRAVAEAVGSPYSSLMVNVRTARSSDLEAIVAIYNQAVVARFQTGDRTEVKAEERRAWLEGHHPEKHPIYVSESEGEIAGWLSISPYRPGREALRFTAEVSYFVDLKFRGRGVASRLLEHAIAQATSLNLKTYFAIVLDKNSASGGLLEKFGFTRWGYLPNVADFDGEECGQLYYGRRVGN